MKKILILAVLFLSCERDNVSVQTLGINEVNCTILVKFTKGRWLFETGKTKKDIIGVMLNNQYTDIEVACKPVKPKVK